jgi:putative heme-binding domain-containing protein
LTGAYGCVTFVESKAVRKMLWDVAPDPERSGCFRRVEEILLLDKRVAMKKPLLLTLLLAGIAVIGFKALPTEPPPEFVVPEGFAVEEVYLPGEGGSPVVITFDSEGRMVLALEDSFIVTLYPTANGGYEERPFSQEVINSQGLLFDGNDLIAASEGPEGVGLYRVVDENGDSRGDRVELIERATGSISDHGPHAPYFGPDGYLYWTLGNFSSLYSPVSPNSPVREYDDNVLEVAYMNGFGSQYRAPGGIFVRKDMQDSEADWELVAIGLRNQYDGAFNLMGELFTLDSDMEWDRDLPWYRPTRSVHIVPGGDYGYREGQMKHPPYYIDTLPMLEDKGRGSPTGVITYQAYNYPAEYYDMVLQADWSRGRIIMGKLAKDGATYTQNSSEDFVFGTPLNVADVEVGPDGNVYFVLGGRGTEGGVYRVVYNGPNAMQRPAANTPLDRVLTMVQPRSSFSRKMAQEIKAQMGDAAWQQGLTAEVRNTNASPERRIRAMELLHVYGPGMDDNVLLPLVDDPSWEVRATTAYYLGTRLNDEDAQETLVEMTKDSDPFVQRRALEGLIRSGIYPGMEEAPYDAVNDIMPLLNSPDRFVRYAARAVLQETNRADWYEAALASMGYPMAHEALLAIVQSMDDPYIQVIQRLVNREVELLSTNPSGAELLSLLRVMQRTMLEDRGVRFGGTGGGGGGGNNQPQTPTGYAAIGQTLLARFPAADTAANREMAKILVYLEPEGTAAKLTAELHKPQNTRTQQIAIADALGFLESGWDAESIERMTSWFEKVYNERWRGGNQFNSYISLIRTHFLDQLPDVDSEQIAQRLDAVQQQLASAPPTALAGDDISPEREESLIFNPSNFAGDFSAGAWAYEKALCITCHTFGPIGTEFGPDLTTINQRFNRQDLVRAVVHPSETVSDLWQVEEVTRRNGEVVTGRLISDGAQEVVLQIPGGGEIRIPRSDVSSQRRSEVSPMPDKLLTLLTNNEQRALFMMLEAGPEAIPDTALTRINSNR